MAEAKTGLIFKKIGDILKEIDPISKGRRNTQQGYSFRGIEDAMNMLAPILAKHGVFPATRSIEDVRNDEVTSKTGTGGYHYVRRYTFAFFAEDGSSVETTVDGEAIDYGDKASNKAYSTAYREAMWKMFIVPFEADDIENHEHNLKPKVAADVPPEVHAPAPAAPNPVVEEYRKKLQAAKNMEELQTIWANMPVRAKTALNAVKAEMKAIFDSETKTPEDANA